MLQEEFLGDYVLDLVLYCSNTMIRRTMSDQIYVLTSRCSQGKTEELLRYFLKRQFDILTDNNDSLQMYANQSNDFFQLLCRLLSFAHVKRCITSNIHDELDRQIVWLKRVSNPTNDILLRGHLNVAKELIQLENFEQKRFYGIEQKLIEQLIEEFIFPASTLLYQLHLKKSNELDMNEIEEPPAPICQSSASLSAAFDLLVALATDCYENLLLIEGYLNKMLHTGKKNSTNFVFHLRFSTE